MINDTGFRSFENTRKGGERERKRGGYVYVKRAR